jgi:hypothetical protein
MITKAAAHTSGFNEDTPTNTLATWMGIKHQDDTSVNLDLGNA